MKGIFIGILILMLIIAIFSFATTNIKARISIDIILLQKSFNYLLSVLISLIAIDIIFITNNNIIYIISSFLSISVYVCVLLYNTNTKWNHYELETNKLMAEWLLRDCTNFQEKDFINFKKNMSRADQIRWLKSLTYIDEETSEELHEDGTKTTITTEEIVPLIEDDEDLKDFDCFLKKM